MHYKLEVIMPPTNNVAESLEQILEKYSENYKDEDGYISRNAFYDWYQIGGRWSGSKLEAQLGDKKMKKFHKLLSKEKITVGSFVAGKETLKPASQIEKVNKLWNDFFPNSPVKVCPLFDNYQKDYADVMKLSELPKDLTACRIIIARPHWENKDAVEAEFMLSTEVWNGLTYQNTAWEGNIGVALKQYKKRIKNYSEEFKKNNTPKKNWICVTVDYHS